MRQIVQVIAEVSYDTEDELDPLEICNCIAEAVEEKIKFAYGSLLEVEGVLLTHQGGSL